MSVTQLTGISLIGSKAVASPANDRGRVVR
jgi:hypothetical protein